MSQDNDTPKGGKGETPTTRGAGRDEQPKSLTIDLNLNARDIFRDGIGEAETVALARAVFGEHTPESETAAALLALIYAASEPRDADARWHVGVYVSKYVGPYVGGFDELLSTHVKSLLAQTQEGARA